MSKRSVFNSSPEKHEGSSTAVASFDASQFQIGATLPTNVADHTGLSRLGFPLPAQLLSDPISLNVSRADTGAASQLHLTPSKLFSSEIESDSDTRSAQQRYTEYINKLLRAEDPIRLNSGDVMGARDSQVLKVWNDTTGTPTFPDRLPDRDLPSHFDPGMKLPADKLPINRPAKKPAGHADT